MREKSKHNYILLLLIGITILAAISVFLYSNGESGEGSDELIVRIVLIPKGLDSANAFWSDVIEGAQMAASEKNVELTVLGPSSETETRRQNSMIEEAIEMRPDAIVLAPSNYTETLPYARKVEEAGIKLVILDSVMEEEAGCCLVATDNLKAGYQMGSYMKPYLNEESAIGIIGHVQGVSTAVEREQGIRDALGEYERQISDIRFCDSNYDKAYERTREMLTENPDINVIFGLNEYSAAGAARAVRDMGLSGEVKMVGFDSSLEEIQFLESGVFDAIVVQRPLNMGYLGVSMAYQAARSIEVPKIVESGSVLITRETIYTEENQKLLFPFRETDEE
ncbi:sugar ABC transporter substrate-binding protein [bacterium 1XD8-76]|nr:sugar ABC transporter substrate-binding protein [bacterium 1XD8-76]